MGGAWERLVRSVKEVIFGLVKNQVLTDSQLLTVLTEAESIVNSRPLTHVSDDPEDLYALTPNHILLGKYRNWSAIIGTGETDITSRKKYKQVQALVAAFWSRWTKEYLPTLIVRKKWKKRCPTFGIDELVLLQDEKLKRQNWPLARITKLFPGKDGILRTVEIRTHNGVYKRPVTKLLKLEDHIFDIRQGEEYVTDGNKN